MNNIREQTSSIPVLVEEGITQLIGDAGKGTKLNTVTNVIFLNQAAVNRAVAKRFLSTVFYWEVDEEGTGVCSRAAER